VAAPLGTAVRKLLLWELSEAPGLFQQQSGLSQQQSCVIGRGVLMRILYFFVFGRQTARSSRHRSTLRFTMARPLPTNKISSCYDQLLLMHHDGNDTVSSWS
jgi:hypothetical protein